MGIKQIFRMRRQPEATDRTVGPEICDFTSTSTAEAILNVARGSGEGRHFKERIPEPYATVHSDCIRIGMYLRDERQISSRIRFVKHAIQLQGKKQGEEDFSTFKYYIPAPEKDQPKEEENLLNIPLIRPGLG